MKTKNFKDYEPDQSWLSGDYVINNQKVEINTKLPFFSVEGYRLDFFAQGENAESIINDIHKYWLKSDTTEEQAIAWWINTFL